MPEILFSGLTVYGAVAAVFAAMVGVGTLPALLIEQQQMNRHLRLPLFVGVGWGLVAIVSAVVAIFDIHQNWPARGLLCIGLLLLVPFGGADRKRQQRQLLGDLVILLILVAPMGLLVAATPAVAFDEFAQWLPNTRYLVEHSRYWFWPDWLGASSKPGYPNASVVVALLANKLIGPTIEAPFKVFAVLLLGGFGAVLASLAPAAGIADASRPRRAPLLALMALAGGILISFIDPFVDPRISLTALADTSTAVILAVAGLTASFGIGAARRRDDSAATGWFAWTGLLSLTLVMLRTTNLVLVGGLFIAIGWLVVAAGGGSRKPWLRWSGVVLGPPAAGALVWNCYLRAARIGADMSPRAMSEWDWTAPLTVIRVFLLNRLSGNIALAGGAALLVGVTLFGGIAVWRRLDDQVTEASAPLRILLALTGIVSGIFVIFLLWTYTAVFSAEEVARAASLWRYLTELGPLVVMAACGVVLKLSTRRHRTGPGWWPLAIGGAACLSVLALPVVGRNYYGLACRYPDVIAARLAGRQLALPLQGFRTSAADTASRVAVVNPTMGDWMAYAIAFDLRWPSSDKLVQFRRQDESLAATEAWAWDRGLDALVDLTPLDRSDLLARPIVPPVSLLGRPAAKGEEWKILATTKPEPLPPCSPFPAR